MTSHEFAKQLKELIEDIKSKGTAAIYCDNLISYLNDVLTSPLQEPTQIELEQYKTDLQLQIEHYNHTNASRLEMFRSVISAGQNAIRTSFMMNGGASIALLAFIGHLASNNLSQYITGFSSALMWFVIGVLAMTITSGATYLSQWLYSKDNQKSQDWGFYINILNIVMASSSYVFFIIGMYCAYHSFKNFV